MSERHPSKPGRQTQSLDAQAAPSGPRLCWALAALFLLLFSLQSVTPQGTGGQVLAFAWPRSLFGGYLWQLLTYPLTLPDLSRLPRGVVGLCLIEYVASLSIVLLMGAQLERRLGARRLAQALLFIVLGSALIAVPALALRPRMGEVLAGPMGMALGVLALYLFSFRDEKPGAETPVPMVFILLSGLLLVTAALQLILSGAEPIERNTVAQLPSVMLGGAAVYLDRALQSWRQRRRDQSEIDLIVEEVNVRARVDELLEKISDSGAGALTRAERRFLEQSARFFREDSSRHRES